LNRLAKEVHVCGVGMTVQDMGLYSNFDCCYIAVLNL